MRHNPLSGERYYAGPAPFLPTHALAMNDRPVGQTPETSRVAASTLLLRPREVGKRCPSTDAAMVGGLPLICPPPREGRRFGTKDQRPAFPRGRIHPRKRSPLIGLALRPGFRLITRSPSIEPCSHRSTAASPHASVLSLNGLQRLPAGQKLGKSFAGRPLHRKHKGPVSGAFEVAGAGFEPATSGL
jgi:hypothetical protein